MGDPLEAELAGWLADARVDEAVAARLRERAQRALATEEATLLGLCLDLAEGRRPVLARTARGDGHRGVLVAVAADFVALRETSGEAVLLPIAHLSGLRPAPGGQQAWSGATARRSDAAGDRRPPLEARLADVLAGLAGHRPRVRLGLVGEPDRWVGVLRACGADVASVALAGEPPTLAWAPLAAVAEVVLVDER